MNFYIGKTIKDINPKDKNVEFSDELIEYLYTMRNKVTFDISILYEIDPYDDIEIDSSKIPIIIQTCSSILQTDLLKNYEDEEEAIEMIEELSYLCNEAIAKGENLISIGD